MTESKAKRLGRHSFTIARSVVHPFTRASRDPDASIPSIDEFARIPKLNGSIRRSDTLSGSRALSSGGTAPATSPKILARGKSTLRPKPGAFASGLPKYKPRPSSMIIPPLVSFSPKQLSSSKSRACAPNSPRSLPPSPSPRGQSRPDRRISPLRKRNVVKSASTTSGCHNTFASTEAKDFDGPMTPNRCTAARLTSPNLKDTKIPKSGTHSPRSPLRSRGTRYYPAVIEPETDSGGPTSRDWEQLSCVDECDVSFLLRPTASPSQPTPGLPRSQFAFLTLHKDEKVTPSERSLARTGEHATLQDTPVHGQCPFETPSITRALLSSSTGGLLSEVPAPFTLTPDHALKEPAERPLTEALFLDTPCQPFSSTEGGNATEEFMLKQSIFSLQQQVEITRSQLSMERKKHDVEVSDLRSRIILLEKSLERKESETNHSALQLQTETGARQSDRGAIPQERRMAAVQEALCQWETITQFSTRDLEDLHGDQSFLAALQSGLAYFARHLSIPQETDGSGK